MATKTISTQEVRDNVMVWAVIALVGAVAFGLGVGSGNETSAAAGVVALGLGMWQISKWLEWSR